MRVLLGSAMLLFLALSAMRADEETPSRSGDSTNLPGAFHPYNVTGTHKGRFHCLISEHGLDPMVLIFYKSVDFAAPLPDLLKRLDAAEDKNPNTRLLPFLVFLAEDVPEVVGDNDDNDDARLELAKKIEEGSADLKLKHVVLCLDGKDDVKKYNINADDLVTIVLCKKLKVVARFALSKDDFTAASIDKVMAAVADKLGATRK